MNKESAFIAQDLNPQIDPKSGNSFTLCLICTSGEEIGFSDCRIAKQKDAWIISELRIADAFRGNKYGTTLLQATCDALWSINKLPICLKPGLPMDEAIKVSINFIIKGLNKEQLCQWYERHGFKQVQSSFNFMCIEPCKKYRD